MLSCFVGHPVCKQNSVWIRKFLIIIILVFAVDMVAKWAMGAELLGDTVRVQRKRADMIG